MVPPAVLPPTSLPRPSSRVDEPAFEPVSDDPPLAPPTAPPDHADEIVILDSGDEILILESDPSEALDAVADAVAAAPELVPPAPATPDQTPAADAGTAAPAKKAPAKKAPAKKTPARKAAKKAAAAKVPAGKAAAKKAPAKKAGSAAWVNPEGGVCPTTHPVKAKLRSAIFHLPGMAAYARTSPDRCYRDEQAAIDDGLRRAAR